MEITQDKDNAFISTMRGYDWQQMQSILYDDYSLALYGVADPLLYKVSGFENMFDANMYLREGDQTEERPRFVSLYFNGAYTFDRRYSLNASIRVDRSNLFGTDPSAQGKPNWSIGAAWNISNEAFMREVHW
jgi:hypothetical protein